MDNSDMEDYKTVVNETLSVLYMRANEDGKRFKTDSYIGMELENLQTNILNLLEDCGDDVEKYKEAIKRVFV